MSRVLHRVWSPAERGVAGLTRLLESTLVVLAANQVFVKTLQFL
jgi:hypothetical protein